MCTYRSQLPSLSSLPLQLFSFGNHKFVFISVTLFLFCKEIHVCHAYWNAKVGSQETPGVTDKFGLGVANKAGQGLIEFYQENSLVTANTLFQQHKRRLYTWASPYGQHWNQTDYILIISSQRWRSSIQSAKTRPGADYGSDHELLIAKFRLKLK